MNWFKKLMKKFFENQHFTISEFFDEFPQIFMTVLYKVMIERLGYRKYCARWASKILSEHHETQRMVSAVDIFARHDEEDELLLNRIVTGDETWIKYVNSETKQQ